MRFEHEHAQRGIQAFSGSVRRCDHRLMAAMDAVEIADGRDGASKFRGSVPPVADDAHGDGRPYAFAGAMTSASPSITTMSPTLASQAMTARRFSGTSSLIVQVATTVSPIFTGALNFSVWPM